MKDLRALRKMLFCNPADAAHDVTLAFMNSRSPAFSYGLLELLFSMPPKMLEDLRS